MITEFDVMVENVTCPECGLLHESTDAIERPASVTSRFSDTETVIICSECEHVWSFITELDEDFSYLLEK